MYQNDRGSYRTKETAFGMFYHSCLGKLVIVAAVLGVLALVARMSRPSEQKMRTDLTDDIRQWIETPDSMQTDGMDDAVTNLIYAFTTADSTVNTALLNRFNKYNRMEYYRRSFYSSMHLYNNFHTEGIRCGVGIFGMVFPLVNFNKLLPREAPVRRDYNQRLIEYKGEEYYGSNPDPIFHGDYDNY